MPHARDRAAVRYALGRLQSGWRSDTERHFVVGGQRADWRADRIAIGHAVRVVAPDFGRVEPVDDPRVPRWLLLLVAALCSPVVLLYAAHGAHNWCEGELFAASSGYSGKHVSPSVWPPGIRCSADIDSGEFEAWWPISW